MTDTSIDAAEELRNLGEAARRAAEAFNGFVGAWKNKKENNE